MRDDTRYTIGEIADATGKKRSTLGKRRQRLGIPSNPDGYTMDEVRRILKAKRRGRVKNTAKTEELKSKLKNNGLL